MGWWIETEIVTFQFLNEKRLKKPVTRKSQPDGLFKICFKRPRTTLQAFLRAKSNTPKQMSFGGLKHPLKPFFLGKTKTPQKKSRRFTDETLLNCFRSAQP